MTTATVSLWGSTIGYVSMDATENTARFEFDPAFSQRNIELAPLAMPLQAHRIYQFPNLPEHSFHGLPGLLADSLPDKYGMQLINVWLAQTGRKESEFNAVDRLCYTGTRAMGALEFEPALKGLTTPDRQLEIEELIELASVAFASKATLDTHFNNKQTSDAMLDILRVGTSAGGARAKAVIAYNPETGSVHSGQLPLPTGYEHWLIKFDGVQFSGDWGIADPAGYGILEYTYYLTAKACGIQMMESQLLTEGGRNHFMTRRFDRDESGAKHFIQTFAALKHYDYFQTGQYSYEQLFMTMKELGIAQPAIEQQFKRAIFNVVGCNQDDHVKNFAFQMHRDGQWDITPAYDLCHAEGSAFTRHHQLSLNGKTSDFTKADFKALASYAGLPRNRESLILEQVVDAFSNWETVAKEHGLPKALQRHVRSTLRLNW